MPTGRQSGFALLLVLIMVATCVVLGGAYMSVAAIHTNMSHNYATYATAQYLAESGFQHGLYILRYNPTQFANGAQLGPYTVTGVNGQYYLSAAANPDGTYTLTATVRMTSATADVIKRTIAATVARTPAPLSPNPVYKGILAAGSANMQMNSNVTINGDVHSNGWFFNMGGRVNGDVTGASDLWNSGTITGQTQSHIAWNSGPSVNVADYASYYLGATHCTARNFNGWDLMSNDATLTGLVTGTNVGGVLQLTRGNTTIHDNVVVHGGVSIAATLTLDGADIVITAEKGFPALIVEGAVLIGPHAKTITINGLVYIRDGIYNNGSTSAAKLTINGVYLNRGNPFQTNLQGQYTVNYDPARALIYDLTLPPAQSIPQVSVVNWGD